MIHDRLPLRSRKPKPVSLSSHVNLSVLAELLPMLPSKISGRVWPLSALRGSTGEAQGKQTADNP
jgi:hypothetical protein